MKLYYSPGACSLSPHITLIEAGLPFELIRVDLRTKLTETQTNYLDICPKGYIPALQMDNGEMLTEGAVIVQYLADLAPQSQLAPLPGTLERYRLQEKLNYLATEIHKGLSPLYNPKAGAEMRESTIQRVTQRVGVLAGDLGDRSFLVGEQFTIADAYAFYCLGAYQRLSENTLASWPKLAAYYERLKVRPSVQAALRTEGLL